MTKGKPQDIRGLLLSGELGAGKTTVLNTLVRDHGFWSPKLITTRTVEIEEEGVVSISAESFAADVRNGAYALPAKFGAYWYAWYEEDLHRFVSSNSQKVVATVRPYTALLLAALSPGLVPVWLWADAGELSSRRKARSSSRDLNPGVARQRDLENEIDKTYEPLFRVRIHSDPDTVRALLKLYNDHDDVN